jgi:D-serine deaminase-like pyridoxal phosphate-dependent protein
VVRLRPVTTTSFAAPVPTPGLVVDLARCERNLASMAGRASAAGVGLRPHGKTHKCPALAARQLEAGAAGLTVATLGEAEVFADHGVEDLFVAYPLWATDDLAARLASLAERVRLAVGADSAEGVELIGAAAGRSARRAGLIRVLVEVDCGLRRSGVTPGDAAGVAVAAVRAGLGLGGVFTFPGHGYAPGMAAAARDDEARALAEAAAALEAAGLPCPVRSGGSTPTAAQPPGDGVNELRPGVYVFNDAQQVALGSCGPEDVALAALATVVSTPATARAVLDAGAKVLGPERPPWVPGHGLLPGRPAARVTGLWEHHAVVDMTATLEAGLPPLRRGDRVAVVPNHVCTAVNLARELHVVAGGEVVDRWAVAAAGANR